MAKISVRVQKLTGEELVMELDPHEDIKTLQDGIQKHLAIPVLCQKLWINDVTVALVQQTVPGMALKMEALISTLNKRDVYEVKALTRPPQMVVQMMQMVTHLLEKQKSPEPTWKECVRYMADIPRWFETLHQWPLHVQDVDEKQVRAAQKIVDDLTEQGKFSRQYFDRVSRLGGVLYEWLLLALQTYKTWRSPGDVTAIAMEGFQPVEAYLDREKEDRSIQVSVVVDYNEVFGRFQSDFKLDEAWDALEVIAAKSRDRSLPMLAKYLKCHNDDYRERALKILKESFEKDDLSAAEEVAQHLKHFFSEESEEGLEALAYLGPSNRLAMKCIISGMNCSQRGGGFYQPRRKVKRVKEEKYDINDDSQEFREHCLEIFKTVESTADPSQVIEDVIEAAVDGARHKDCSLKGALQKEVLEALALVAARNYDYAMSLVVKKLRPAPPESANSSAVVARTVKAACSFVKMEDEMLLEALSACASDPEQNWEMPALTMVAECFQEISASRSPFVDKILERLGEEPSDATEAFQVLGKVAPQDDERVIDRLQRSLREAHETIHYEGPAVVKAAAECLEEVLSDKSMVLKAYERLLNLLIHRCCGPIAAKGLDFFWQRHGRRPWKDSGDRMPRSPTHKFLMKVAQKVGGVKNIHLWNIALGFNSTIIDVRLESLRIFKRIRKSPEAQSAYVLFKLLDENFSTYSCCVAIDALLHCAPSNQPEVTDKLLQLLKRPECAVQTAALEALTKYVTDSPLKDLAVQCLNDKDPFVRRAAMTLLIQRKLLVHDDLAVLMRCLQDSSSDVVMLTLRQLAEMRLSQDVLGPASQGLVHHVDPTIRLEVTKLMQNGGPGEAFARVWPELDDEVRKARQGVVA